MKIATSIKPRRDGTVVARCPSGSAHTFKAEAEGGELMAEVAGQADIAFLLRQGGDAFYPADDSDFAAAGAILGSTAVDASGDGDGDDDDDIDPDDPDGDTNAAPVEANTPPARVKPAGKKAGKKAAA